MQYVQLVASFASVGATGCTLSGNQAATLD